MGCIVKDLSLIIVYVIATKRINRLVATNVHKYYTYIESTTTGDSSHFFSSFFFCCPQMTDFYEKKKKCTTNANDTAHVAFTWKLVEITVATATTIFSKWIENFHLISYYRCNGDINSFSNTLPRACIVSICHRISTYIYLLICLN